MVVLGIGVDVLHLPRVARIVAGKNSLKFATRILSPRELSEWTALNANQDRSTRYLAVRWAVKEAAYKALYPRFCPTWKELTYHKPDGPKPMLEFTHESKSQGSVQGSLDLQASVSHDGEYVFASVLAQLLR